MMTNVLHYAKAVVGFLGALLTYAVTLPGFLDLPSWVGSVGVLLTFAGIYFTKNKPVERIDADEYKPRHAYEESDEPKLI